ncbi:hypothetical protein Aperf_G00000020091 [Anoplocephala perfoliata]
MSEFTSNFLSYESLNRHKVTFCAFSQCGKYFGFVENRNHVRIYRTSQLTDISASNKSVGDNSVLTLRESAWRVGDTETQTSVSLEPIVSLDANNSATDVRVNYLVFGDGNVTHCRLPHRLTKRRSIVTKYPDRVCVLALAKSNGYIDVFNIDLLNEHYSPTLAKMVLYDGRQSIVHLSMSTEGALRLASTSCRGVVKLWDIWDDGNMYATLTSTNGGTSFVENKDLITSGLSAVPYNHEVTVTAWHPFEGHIFLGDRKGHGLVLQDEKPYKCLHLVRLHHMISGAVYSGDGDFLLTASFDGSCALWSVPSYTQVFSVWHMAVKRNVRLLGGANDFHVTALALAPDSESFATFCEDGTIRLWPLSRTLQPQILTHKNNLDHRSLHERTLAWCPSGQLLACSLGDHRLQIWNRIQLARSSLMSLCLSAIRRYVVSGLFAKCNSAPYCHGAVENEDNALAALSALPLPRPLRALLRRDLEPGVSATTTSTVVAKF